MATYKEYDKNGRLIATVAGVLSPVQLTAVVTTNGSNRITVASTTGVYPGMPVSCPNVPVGSFVHGIVSSTVLELWCSSFSAAGVWTTSAANAQAAVAASPESGLIAYAYGFSEQCMLTQAYARGMWRNLFTASGMNTDADSTSASAYSLMQYGESIGKGVVLVPTAGSWLNGVWSTSASTTVASDTLVASPVKRHNGELWGMRPFISTGGARSYLVANPENRIVFTS